MAALTLLYLAEVVGIVYAAVVVANLGRAPLAAVQDCWPCR